MEIPGIQGAIRRIGEEGTKVGRAALNLVVDARDAGQSFMEGSSFSVSIDPRARNLGASMLARAGAAVRPFAQPFVEVARGVARGRLSRS
jgi:hypothetical protein